MDIDDGDVHGDVDFCEAPSSMQGHRACLRCGLVKCMDQFYANGCENCPFLEMIERQDRVTGCTTSNFEGVVALVQPEKSWLAKWEALRKFYPGVYALQVFGEMPPQIQEFLIDKGIACRAVKDDD